MTKFTPGPWEWDWDTGWLVHPDEHDEDAGTIILELLDKYILIQDAVGKADARLIAAAPDMFEALEEFVEAWDKSLQLEKTDVALTKARAALELAGGSDEQLD